jgi:enoyl-CoA hydratase/carnithine racemase
MHWQMAAQDGLRTATQFALNICKMSENEPTNPVRTESSGTVAVVTLVQPPHNFVTEPVLRELADALERAGSSHRAVVLASEGKSFCAGANFRSPGAPAGSPRNPADSPRGPADSPSSPATFEDFANALYTQAIRIFRLEVPLIAAIQGPAIGAGMGLALACDQRVGGPRAWQQANFVKLGIHPGFALSLTLPATVGLPLATDLMLTGRRIQPEEALRAGLLNRLAEEGEELQTAVDLASQVASGAPLALSATKATLKRALLDKLEATLAHEVSEQARLAATKDAAEGIAAMLERRDPVFSGS